MIVEEADSLDFIITTSEKEALILEANLIYKYKPKYNVLLKGTEVYPYVRISDDEFPYVEIVRRKRGKGEFFGPFTNVKFLRNLLEILQWYFKIRTCQKDLSKIKRACMDYHIGLCSGPCVGAVSKEEYERSLEGLRGFLKGNVEEFKGYLKERMEHHAKMLDFENAAKYRDVLNNLESLLEKQGVVLNEDLNLDVVVGRDDLFVVLRIRGGVLMGKLVYEMRGGNLREFVEHFYTVEAEMPETIIVEEDLETLLDVEIRLPKDDIEDHLLKMALENLEMELRMIGIRKDQLRRLAEFLGLDKIERIEGIDISHLMGRGTVASVVVFVGGKPSKEDYRRYRLSDGKIDDYKAIHEVVKRRYSKHPVPDLLLIDGGIGQVRSAISALKRIKKETKVVGIAKSQERIVTESGEFVLPLDSPVLRALVSVRDEAHRFANEYGRKVREKETLKSILESIKGIGPVRKRKLIEHFKTIEDLKKASVEEIAKVVGSKKLAEEISKLV